MATEENNLTTLLGLIKPLTQLLEKGSCLSNNHVLVSLLKGLAHPASCDNSESNHWVASQRLMQARTSLQSDDELIAALLVTGSKEVLASQALQQAWCQLIAGRCNEASQLSDPQLLVNLVTQLDAAAEWVFSHKGNASLKATAFAELERNLLGASAEQNQVTPTLARVLAVASQLSGWQQQELPCIDTIEQTGQRPDINWCHGRLIQRTNQKASEFQYVLNGMANQPLPRNLQQLPQKELQLAVMKWVVANPWAYLLTLIVYEQYVWQMEASGALLLELPAGQSEMQPTAIQVLVANNDGDELYCGSFGAFVLKILSSLNMAIFPNGMTEAELNAELSQVISQLIQYKVWRFFDGLSGEQGFYQIDPDFSDVCYGRVGQPSFSRYAKNLRQAIRSQAIQWRSDSQMQAKLINTQELNASAA
ncbi:hypothetical protein IC617_06000 [Neiella sp. HB171785]|uniref:Uncharacterized protein n=1 Tax=Neiella litorisoli TaxID=2771431 RepID=A0A8J6QIW8_9GAMM|nr:hypothetical protein [Neiella litorisoli]MBD1388976.1 hypothetical protein [Neiella litorisoli]